MEISQKKTLYVSDLDGTLLNTRDQISQKSLDIINTLIAQGMHFTYATARSLVSARKVTAGLRTDIPVIVYNGAFIMNAGSGQVLYSCSFTKEERQFAKEILQRHGIAPLVYSFVDGKEKVSWQTTRENDGIRRYLSLRPGDHRLRPLPSPKRLYDGDIFYYTCIGSKEELQPVYDILKDDPRYNCTLQQELYRPEYWCEIMPKKATKAEAVQQLKKIWNCDKIICFGDAVNDISIFKQADEAYAVANAVPELRQIATGIISENDRDGVALWLKENVRLKERGKK